MADMTHQSFDQEPMPEGEEAPPKGMKTMAHIRWGILIVLSIFAVFMVVNYFGGCSGGGNQAAAVKYYCPMHPTYITDKPGECPICGMDLIVMPAQSKTSAAVKYYCPMDTTYIKDAPGECPICGMDLVVMPQKAQASSSMAGMEGFEVPGTAEVTIEPHRLQMIGIRTAKVERRPLDDQITLAGSVAADETRTHKVTIRASGWVKELFVDQTGQYVKAGQPLLSIYSQELYQAGQDLLVAKNSADQNTPDTSLTAMRRKLLDAARQRLHLLGLADTDIDAIEQSGTAQSTITLHSPVSGYVLEKSVSPGQYVGMEQTLYTVADLSMIWVIAEVYEQNLSDVKVGQPATLRLAAYPDETFEGKVGFIYPSVSETTRTIKIRLEFANHDLHLRPGMFGDVAVQLGGENVLAVPAEAVMDDGDVKYVFVVSEGKHFTPRKVSVGRTTTDWMEVVGGLAEGEEVVTSANFLIDSESRLKAAVAGMGGASEKAEIPVAAGEHNH
ncbi:MAG: efflux RND transporter periplasmic adaptor subunit [candidate division Zixibacteria bacterium]|nr:efflux RND transporter periplasmic adaptor subunit [candidate division Zixibacteria bacterium]